MCSQISNKSTYYAPTFRITSKFYKQINLYWIVLYTLKMIVRKIGYYINLAELIWSVSEFPLFCNLIYFWIMFVWYAWLFWLLPRYLGVRNTVTIAICFNLDAASKLILIWLWYTIIRKVLYTTSSLILCTQHTFTYTRWFKGLRIFYRLTRGREELT